jgi:hypothetical protein
MMLPTPATRMIVPCDAPFIVPLIVHHLRGSSGADPTSRYIFYKHDAPMGQQAQIMITNSSGGAPCL